MKYIPIPANLWQVTRYAMLIEEQRILLGSWKQGTFVKLAEFGNDTQGQGDIADFFKRHGTKLAGKSLNICVSLIGEDYRFEKTAHLTGKYKTDMIRRKVSQLFRGATYYTYQGQGREDVGRRLDMILFCGILSNDKVQPWVRIVQRYGMHVAGMHQSSLLSCTIAKTIASDLAGNHVISLISDEGTVRHNFFVDGNLRFSRMSKISSAADPAALMHSIRGEIDKTAQYLTSLKIMQQGQRITAHLVCADDLQAPMQQMAAETEGERIRLKCHSAQQLCQTIGAKRPISEYGRDSTPVMHQMLRSLYNPFGSLAPVTAVRYSTARLVAIWACVGVAVWSAWNMGGSGLGMIGGVSEYATDNDDLARQIQNIQSDYDRQRERFQAPPSSLDNMEAAVNLLDRSLVEKINPGKMMHYVGNLLSDNQSLQVDELNWFISNGPATGAAQLAFATGFDVYEVVEINGIVVEGANPERTVAAFASMVDEIGQRPDMAVEVLRQPTLVETGGRLTGDLDISTDVRGQLNEFSERGFAIRIAWQAVDLEDIEEESS